MKQYIHYLRPLIPLFVFAGAAWLLYHEIKQYHVRELADSIAAISSGRILAAIGLVALDYAILVRYDLLAVRYLGYPLDAGRVALASFVSYVCSHNFGGLLGGTGMRFRMYSLWGVPSVDIVKLVVLVSVTFWLGLIALAGPLFVFVPLQVPERLHLPFDSTRVLGFLLLGLLGVYLALCAARHAPVQIRGWSLPFPSLRLSLLQVATASAELLAASNVLYVLLPASTQVDYPHFLGIYLLGILAAVITNVPGGLGVFELTVIVLLPPGDPRQVLGSLLVYRAVYYLLPLLVAAGLMGGYELVQRRRTWRRVAAVADQVAPALVPRLFALGAFVAGAILLFSGAFPTKPERLRWTTELLPLALFESSHFSASLLGVALLLVARSLLRRLDSAYWATLALLGTGAVLAVFRAFDYEEATVLLIILLALIPCRRHFYRRGSLVRQPFSLGWNVGVVLVLLCSIWLGIFAHKHVEYSHDLWWRVAFRADAPRFLRASVGAVGLALALGLWKLLGGRRRMPDRPARRTWKSCGGSWQNPAIPAQLALLGDKMFLFNEPQTAFLMFAIQGRSWVALGDPVGPPEAAPGLILRLREMADSYDDWAVFYQVDGEHLSWYADVGLSALKIGEEARVPLAQFSLEGGPRKPLRKTHNRFARLNARFEIVPPSGVASLLPELKTVSDAWLTAKSRREKRFSAGWFSPEYLRRFPAALIRHQGRIVAFANVLGAGNEELSIDLMRYLPDVPEDVMEQLFIELMLWGKEEGYQWFNLGMAPLSGLDSHPLAPTWNRVGALIFRLGEEFYNFQGLRRFKEQFDPVWRPKYLTSHRGLALPVILTNIAALINRSPTTRVPWFRRRDPRATPPSARRHAVRRGGRAATAARRQRGLSAPGDHGVVTEQIGQLP